MNSSNKHLHFSDLYRILLQLVFHEYLRQARHTFNLSVVVVALSLGLSVIGAVLLIYGKAPEGSVTIATGLISTTLCSQIDKESGKKLKALRKYLEKIRPSSKK